MGQLLEPFTQANGALGNGWSTDAAFGGSDPIIQVVSNKGSTNGSTTLLAAVKAHGLTLTGNWQLDVDFSGPLIIGDGGLSFAVVSNSTFNGYGFFVGNALHIARYDSFSITYVTNFGRPNEGTAGVQANHVTLTRTSAGVFNAYLDGTSWGSITDTTYADAGNVVVLSINNATAPTNNTTIDNVVVQDSIGVVPAIQRHRLFVPNCAVQRAASR